MKYLVWLLCMFLVGCGTQGKSSPPPPFADLAGSYTATVTAASSALVAANPIGTILLIQVTADGILTTPSASFQLTRSPDQSVVTNSLAIAGGKTELIWISADHLSAITYVWTSTGALYGTITYAVNRTGSFAVSTDRLGPGLALGVEDLRRLGLCHLGLFPLGDERVAEGFVLLGHGQVPIRVLVGAPG